MIKNIIKFYKDCYQYEYKGIRINSFLSKECEHCFIPDTLELLSGKSISYPVPYDWGEKVESVLLLDSKEKSLYGGSIFVKVTIKRLTKKIRCVTPLYIHELKLHKEKEIYYLSIEDTFVNPVFVECINAIDDELKIKYDRLEDDLPLSPIGFEQLDTVENTIINSMPNWNICDFKNLYDADFNNKRYTENLKSKKYNSHSLYSSFMIGIFKRPTGSRGVLSELETISNNESSSSLLDQYFGVKPIRFSIIKERSIHVPVSLSEAQKQVFYKSDASDVSMVVGPPGTGKSYTIAALAIDNISRGNSVLIASKNNQSGKVIASKIEHDLGIKKILIKTETQFYKRSLIAKLNKIIYGIKQRKKTFHLKSEEASFKELQKEIDNLILKLIDAEKNELQWGEFYYNNIDSFFTRLKAKWIEYKKRKTVPVWKINQQISEKQKLKSKKIKNYVKQRYEQNLESILQNKRKDFVKLMEALQEESGNVLQSKFENIDFDLVLKALPAWISNTKEISKFLPLNQEMFDVAIIDEASQCDIATTIPILFRAKKIIVVGDPKQLRHYSFLSDQRQIELKDKHQVPSKIPNYRKSSLLDLTSNILASQDQLTFLDEHFRSKPDLIRFSNQQFYGGNLHLMRANPLAISETNNKLIIVNGYRDEKGVNVTEAYSILENIKKIVYQENKMSVQLCTKIGILSPFHEQTKFIKKLIRTNLENNTIKKHKLLIGTPFHFQGEERDMMFISFAIDDYTHPSVYNYLNREDVFNVSITRARDTQYNFISFDFKRANSDHLICKYLSDIEQVAHKKLDSNMPYDLFCEDVVNALNKFGIKDIYRSCFVSGVKIDLAVIYESKTYAIDLIGYPGEFTEQFTVESLQMLDRMNQPIFFIPYSSWVLDREKTIGDLLIFFGS